MPDTPDRTSTTRRFLGRPVTDVAPDPLGRTLVRRTDDGPTTLRLTGPEAYAGEADPASHADWGRTARNTMTSGPPGQAHGHFTHGMPRRST
ncbi:DNA-3-methyladenine glycosylase [Streptomyces sp. SCSIO 30461]|uniref:DNA-3-methyladenine glycosylase n=1 Tax=Streptomyces sp. SCSIO 30461 TaxID=3118085 RepID=UPI00387E8AA9